MATALTRDAFSLEAKFRLETGRVFMSGVQALVRLPLDQHRADRRRGLDTATLISGYRGSPLGGLDQTVERHRDLLAEHQVVFISGVNEDLGATAVLGSQLAHLYGGARHDGVLGMWYGKAPGVDRSGDILRHANFYGEGRNGGVLALAGDDPQAKSSTLPTHSEVAFYDFQMPDLFPGSIQDILDLGRLGFELSRYSGLWVAFKVVTDVADAVGTAEVQLHELVDAHVVVDLVAVEVGLEIMQLVGVGLLSEQRRAVVILEGKGDPVAVVLEVEHEAVVLLRVRAVQARQGLHRLNAGERLVHVHRVQ